MKRIFFSIMALVILCITPSGAQNFRPSYSGHFSGGMLYGSNKTKIQLQTIHGIKAGTWYAGAGVAMDDYFQQSIPLFLDIRKSILRKTATPFVYIDGGINLLTKGSETQYLKTVFKPDIYYDAGIGYHIALNNKLAINMAAGYNVKGYTENTYLHASLPIPPYITESWELSKSKKYMLQRYVMRIGLQF